MLARQPILWIAGGVLAAATVFTSFTGSKEEETKQAAAPDLFAFVQPLPQAAQDAEKLPEAEEQSESTAMIASVPPEAIAAADAFRAEEAVRRMRAQGASDDEVYRARAAAMSAEKAAALASLDYNEHMWNQRVAAYQAQRGALDAYTVQELRNRMFSAEEQERLAAYEPSAAPLPGLP